MSCAANDSCAHILTRSLLFLLSELCAGAMVCPTVCLSLLAIGAARLFRMEKGSIFKESYFLDLQLLSKSVFSAFGDTRRSPVCGALSIHQAFQFVS